ncbi:Uncharacterised protein [Vibrio cholerae]|nr:Uncharacterised protein [Vibrio cholerae]
MQIERRFNAVFYALSDIDQYLFFANFTDHGWEFSPQTIKQQHFLPSLHTQYATDMPCGIFTQGNGAKLVDRFWMINSRDAHADNS